MADTKVTARILNEEEYDHWNSLVDDAPCGSIYSRPQYLDVLCSATGGRFSILGVFRGDALVGGAGLYRESASGAEVLSNRLLLYYNGVVLAAKQSTYPHERQSWDHSILDPLEQFVRTAGFARTVLHNRCSLTDTRLFQMRGWTVRPSYSFVVNLQDLEAGWGRVQQNLRRLVRRSEKEEIELTCDDDFDSFFRLHHQIHQRKGAPLYLPQESFRQYFQKLRDRGWSRLYHARLPGGQSIAAQLVLACTHPVSHTVCAGADSEHQKTGASAFLRWKAFEALASDGYHANDLTDAALNDVTRFKSQLGGDLVTNMVLSLPDSGRYRINSALGRVRSLAGMAVHRLKGKT